MVKKCLNSICIQWDLWQPSSGRNEEALRGPQRCHLSLGRGQGIFYHRGLSLEGDGRDGRACGRGEAQLIMLCQLQEAWVSKACSLLLGTWKETDWISPQLWLIQLFPPVFHRGLSPCLPKPPQMLVISVS